MILSAMIFAGVTFIVGILLGFLLGQARSRMNYEEALRKSEQARVLLENQLSELRAVQPQSSNQSSAAAAAERQGEEIKR